MAYRLWPLRINSPLWLLPDVALHLYSYGFALLIWRFIAWLGPLGYALRYHVVRPSGPAWVLYACFLLYGSRYYVARPYGPMALRYWNGLASSYMALRVNYMALRFVDAALHVMIWLSCNDIARYVYAPHFILCTFAMALLYLWYLCVIVWGGKYLALPLT